MKKIVVLLAVLGVAAYAVNSWAGGGCCPSKAKSGQSASLEKSKDCGADYLSGVNLSDEQKEQIASLKAECDNSGCSATSHEKFTAGLKEILTAEQMEQCRKTCADNGWQCPLDKFENKASAATDQKS